MEDKAINYKLTVNKTTNNGGSDNFQFYVQTTEGTTTKYVQADGSLGADKYLFDVTANGTGTVVTLKFAREYEVVEEGANGTGFTTSYSADGKVTVSDEHNAATSSTITIENTYQTIPSYEITVTKTVNLTSLDGSDFEFYVKYGSYYINANGEKQTDPYAHKVTAGSTTGTVVTVHEDGEYTISEVAPTVDPNYNWSVAYSVTDGKVTLNSANTSAAVDIQNTYSPKQNTQYSITVNKVLEGVNGNENFEFSVKNKTTGEYVDTNGDLTTTETFFTVTSGSTGIKVNVNVAGTYEIIEKSKTLSGYEFVSTTYSTDACVVDDNNADGNVTITNKYNQIVYSIDVTKNATGAPASMTSYKFTVSNGAQFVNANGALQADAYEFTVASGETRNIKVPTSGTYTVTEVGADVNGYNLTTTYDTQTVTLTDSANKGSVTISNQYEEITPTPATVTPTPATPTPTEPEPTLAPTTPVPTPEVDVDSQTVTPVTTPTPAPVKPILVVVDGSEVDAGKYTVDGDGKVTLTEDFVKTLPDGSHKMVATYPDGSTTTTEFVVTTTPVATGNTKSVQSTSGVVATGETSSEYKIQVALVFFFAAVAVFVYRKRYFKPNN